MEKSLEYQNEVVDLVNKIKNQIFNLSLKFLNDFDSAEDATQDILIKIIKKYPTLIDRNKAFPWALKIATNHLINLKVRNNRFEFISFDIMEQDCKIVMSDTSNLNLSTEETDKLQLELKISCTLAMLMCLSKEERIVYVLSSMFNLSSVQGGEMMSITPELFRKKLSRAKHKLRNFLESNCGLINKDATCKCRNRLGYAIKNNRISFDNPTYLSPKYLDSNVEIRLLISQMEKFDDYSDVFKTNPDYIMRNEIRELVYEALN